MQSRLDILKIHSRRMNLMRGIDLKKIAEKMNGASGAELKVYFICIHIFGFNTWFKIVFHVETMWWDCWTPLLLWIITLWLLLLKWWVPSFSYNVCFSSCKHMHVCVTLFMEKALENFYNVMNGGNYQVWTSIKMLDYCSRYYIWAWGK